MPAIGLAGKSGLRDAYVWAVFDRVNPARKAAVRLKLKSKERRETDALWLRYEIVRS
jgi:hypothetical protein